KAFKAFRRIKEILNLGGIVVLFPEGGRTFKGENFSYSEKGKKIRQLKAGVGWLVLKTNSLIIPVWIDGAEKVLPNKRNRLYHCLPNFCNRVTVKIGKPIHIEGKNKEEITQEIALSLLKLADEEE
ncbi:MAG: lysophospholipid acyltransferase family protein, partial [Anaerolineae bacterium]|nr:lysophospholipid acyltransferase family protein [Anaerolineae bacterium]